MCNPVYLQAAGLALSFFQIMQNANAQEDAGATNRQITESNARLYDQQAAESKERGKTREDELRRQIARDKGKQQAKFGAGNVILDTGSPSDVLEDIAQIGELDIRTSRANTQREVQLRQQQAANTRYGGGIQYSQDMNTASNTRIGAIGSLATGAGQVADKWYQRKPTSYVTTSKSGQRV